MRRGRCLCGRAGGRRPGLHAAPRQGQPTHACAVPIPPPPPPHRPTPAMAKPHPRRLCVPVTRSPNNARSLHFSTSLLFILSSVWPANVRARRRSVASYVRAARFGCNVPFTLFAGVEVQ
ncbi:unnamed protein product, partial [Iphiclides podalirius]